MLFYYSLVHSDMTYCLVALNPLKVIQNKIFRAIVGLNTTDHTNDSYISLELFKDLYNFACSSYTCKSLHTLIPSHNYFYSAAISAYSRRDNLRPRPTLASSSRSQSHVRYRGAVIFNNSKSKAKLL